MTGLLRRSGSAHGKMQNAKRKIGKTACLRPYLTCGMLLACLAAAAAGAAEGEHDPFFPADRPATGPARTTERDEWGRDPFDNPFGGQKTAGAPGPREAPGRGALTGIIYSPGASFAIVGGDILRIGGKVGSKTIKDIRRKGIVLQDPSGAVEEIVLDDSGAGK